MIHYEDPTVTLLGGDCLDVLRGLPDASVDSIVTDPPYGLEFMGKEWDAPWKHGFGETGYTDGKRMARPNFGSSRNPVCTTCRKHQRGTKRCQCETPTFDERPADSNVAFQLWCEQWATECLRVLKPGGHMLAFGGSRTFHRLTCAVEDAGFEIRDSISWLYGSGFPKSLDVSKAIDKAAGAQREVVGTERTPFKTDKARERGTAYMSAITGDTRPLDDDGYQIKVTTAPATDDARTWQGWGTALKPGWEPIVVGRKPLSGTVAGNVLAHGTGALNIDACRIGDDLIAAHGGGVNGSGRTYAMGAGIPAIERGSNPHAGRWPANVVLDEDAAAELDEQSGYQRTGTASPKANGFRSEYVGGEKKGDGFAAPASEEGGGASRFFYTAKADAGERVRVDGVAHPTVKPLSLMRWLVRLVTPPGGTVLEPFAGSGTTVEACILEGFRCVAIEREASYLPLIVQRINRQRDPIAYTEAAGEDLGLFGLEDVS